MKFSIEEFFSKCVHLLKKFLMENFIFCAVLVLISLLYQFHSSLSKSTNKKISKHN